MSELTSGMLWLVTGDKMEKRIGDALEYAEAKHGKVLRIMVPLGESYPHEWGAIPVQPDKRIVANHLYLVTRIEVTEGGQS